MMDYLSQMILESHQLRDHSLKLRLESDKLMEKADILRAEYQKKLAEGRGLLEVEDVAS